MSNVRWSRDSHPVRVKYVLVQKLWATFQTLRDEIRRERSKSPKKKKPHDIQENNESQSPGLSRYYDLPFTVGPNVFFLGAADGWGLGFGADAGFFGFGCRDLRPRISQYLLHWCRALNWSMKDVAQFPLKPLYLKKEYIINTSVSTLAFYICQRFYKDTYPFLEVAIPTSVSLIPTPANHNIQTVMSANLMLNLNKCKAFFLTLHVSDQQVALSLVVDPVLEGTTLLSCLRVAPPQVDLFAILDWVLDKVPDQLFLQRCIRDVVGRTVDQVDGNDPGGRMKRNLELEFYMVLR